MREIEWTNTFKRDYKREQKGRYANNLNERLHDVFKVLIDDAKLEPKYRDHALIGEWLGCRDCHIFPDLVLVYKLTISEVILIRLGSHAKLNLT